MSSMVSPAPSMDTNVSKTSIEMDQKDTNRPMIEQIIAILSENKLKIWFDVGIRDEYQRRYGHSLPSNWIQVLQSCGRDVIEVNVQNYSNVSKTFIALPIKTARKSTGGTPTMAVQMDKISVIPVTLTQTVTNVVPNASPPPPLVANNGIKCQTNERSVIKTNGASNTDINHQRCSQSEDMLSGDQRPVPSPILPVVNRAPVNSEDFFDCVVLLAATPKNFVVVPFANVATASPFASLKLQMYEFYETDDNRIELSADLVTEGLYVAGQARDIWYRCHVRRVISRDPFQVIVYLCDYGEHLTLDLKHIQPLYSQFRDLPAQAIRATLAGIEPVGVDWDVSASVEFRKLVESRPFVATVLAINIVDKQPVLLLSLCDTSGTDDVYVSAALIAKQLAKPVVTV